MSPALDAVACVLPAFNAAPTIPQVVAGLRAALGKAFIIGIDDGSADQTRRVLESLADVALVHEVNRGKGAALRTGFSEALARGCAAVLTIDSDGQHDPAFAPALLAALEDADVVVGTRTRTGTHMPLHRRIANAMSSAAISACAGCPLPDTQSGYRAIRAEVLRSVKPLGDRYEYETSFLILAARAGYRIASVPISTIYGAPSHFREIRDAMRVVHTIWRHRPGTLH